MHPRMASRLTFALAQAPPARLCSPLHWSPRALESAAHSPHSLCAAPALARNTRGHPPRTCLRASNAGPRSRPLSVWASSAGADSGAAAAPTAPPSSSPVLVLYSKEGCCLCDALKEKLEEVTQRHAAGVQGGALAGLQVQVRDILSNPVWLRQYEMEIPVMARLAPQPDGTCKEVVIPRQPPRASVDRLEKALLQAFSQ